MPDTRICTTEAAKIMGCSVTAARDRAMRLKWDIELMPNPNGGKKRLMYKRSTVAAYGAKEEKCKTSLRYTRPHEIRDLVEWANGLRRWPLRNVAIRARVSILYHVKDIEGVIDTRVFRKKSDGEYFRALREPAMKREDSILGG